MIVEKMMKAWRLSDDNKKTSKNCTKLLNIVIAIIVAWGDKYDSRKNDESLEVIWW